MTQRSVMWGDLRAPELRELAKAPTIVIVPVAALEQHGPHLPVITDCALGGEVARRAAMRIAGKQPVLVTPTVWTGLSEHHMAHGATITLDFAGFLAVLRGIVTSIRRHGFTRVLLLNSHGGNIAALRTVVEELTRDLAMPGLTCCTTFMLAADLIEPLLDTQKGVRHACEAETAGMMVLQPENVDESRFAEAAWLDPGDQADALDDGSYRWRSFRDITPSGAIGDPTAATPEKGEKLLDAMAGRLAERLLDTAFWG